MLHGYTFSYQITPGIIIDYNRGDNVIGIEILGIKERLSVEELSRVAIKLSPVMQNPPLPQH